MQERKKPGRPARNAEAHESGKRPPRIPMSAGNKLQAQQREGYQRYWAITGPDHPGKLEQMRAAWWEFVLDEDGQKIEQPAGKGNMHVLMEIEQQYYDEDMAAQQKRNLDATQNNIQTLGEDEYVPMGQKSVMERDII